MSETSSEDNMETEESDITWKTVKKKEKHNKRRLDSPPVTKKKSKTMSTEEINTIILGAPQKTTSTKNDQQINTNRNSTRSNNYSARMTEIRQKQYINLFYINTKTTNRIEMAEMWENERPANSDVILRTIKGFLLKSNTPKVILNSSLLKLKTQEKITEFTETNPYTKTPSKSSTAQKSLSCVIASVELEITDTQISEHLSNLQIDHRYCKRITSKATNKPCQYIRIITASDSAYEKLLSEGLFYKCRHYLIYPSTPPPPAPLPCNKCLEFTHKTEDCTSPPKCSKCNQNHDTNKCKSSLPPKCNACSAEDHQAWSFKCPKRPTKPIDGIPNIPIKNMNKKSNEITNPAKKKSKIHRALTVHDVIINTYVNKLNKPKNINREELLLKLRKRFIAEYNIDTSVSFFSGNRIYILMFDMETPDSQSPTEPQGEGSSQVLVHA